MTATRLLPVALAAVSALSVACAAAPPAPGGPRPQGTGNAIVIDDAMIDASHGSVLAAMRGRLSGMSLSRGDGCPEIAFRGRQSYLPGSGPLVYVEGQRVVNTCVLETLNPDDVARVEVYPGGVTARPGYHSDAGGLILVFLKDGQVG